MISAIKVTSSISRLLILTLTIIIFSLYITSVYAEESTDEASPTASPKGKPSQRIEATKAAIKEKVEAKKSEIQTMRDERKAMIASREAELKAKLEKFRDQKKATAVERINKALNAINTKLTTHFKNTLDRLTALLNKLESRVDNGSPDVKDVASAKDAITKARDSIASASAAVSAQMEKDYTVVVSSETKAKTDLKEVKDQLMTDLKAVRAQVKEAKKLVADAIRITKSGKPVTQPATESAQEEEASASGQQ